MRVTDYRFVFDDWHPEGFEIQEAAYDLIWHTGLPYVEFFVGTPECEVSVRCDPCSADQPRWGYRERVRQDLELEIAKQRRHATGGSYAKA